MGIKTLITIAEVSVLTGVLANYDIDSPAQRRPPKTSRYHAFVNLNAVYHIYRNIININIISLLSHWQFIYKKTNALAL